MKNIILILSMLCFFEKIVAQTPEFLLPLYFTDSKGNKDTVFNGYDIAAKYGFIEGDFGEHDIRYEPFDTAFEARLGSFKNTLSASYPFMSKQSVERRSCFKSTPAQGKGINTMVWVYFLTKNFPITISWDTTLIDKECRYNSFFHRRSLSTRKNFYPEERKYLRDSLGKFTVTKSYLKSVPPLAAPDFVLDNGDTLYCLILYLLDKNKQAFESTSIEDLREDAGFINISPNPTYSSINVKVEDEKVKIKKIDAIDLNGKLLHVNIPLQAGESDNEFSVDVGAFTNGLYFLKIGFDDGSTAFKRFLKL
jgi:Secretion system C-terminal sorting domain